MKTVGLHHVTCIAVDPQTNLDFYTSVLGLRLVKTTVNFDAPDVYHFYFGDPLGHPGTLLTFFPFTDAGRGRAGTGVTENTSFAVPKAAFEGWVVRLEDRGVATGRPFTRFGDPAIGFEDPDGLSLELVGVDDLTTDPEAIAGFSSVRLRVEAPDRTVAVLTELLGFAQTDEADGVRRYRADSAAPGRYIDVVCSPGSLPARPGGGSVHHIAFRATDRTALAAWRREVAAMGLNVTPIIDRSYFESIYFREPGGVLFEIATDPPGFATDEPVESLGTGLKLPPRLERDRANIERRLAPVVLPGGRRQS